MSTDIPLVPPASALAFASAIVHRCFLCDSSRLHVMGAFLPDHPALWTDVPLRPGRMRALFYGLCRQCMKKARKTKGKVVEDKLLAAMAAAPRGQGH